MKPVFGSAGAVILAAFSCACASALKEAPPLADLAPSAAPLGPADIDALLARAGALQSRRDLLSMRQAARLYFQVAAAGATGSETLVTAAQTEVWLADHETDPAERRAAAKRAVQASQWCGTIDPERPECVYWMGASLGVQARERPSTGLAALPQIEASFKEAAKRAPEIDRGGPDRALALLYLRAPGWPVGPGDAGLGLLHARRAIDLFPRHPPNLAALGEALQATGSGEAGRAAYRQALELARADADPDAPDWFDEAERALGERPGH